MVVLFNSLLTIKMRVLRSLLFSIILFTSFNYLQIQSSINVTQNILESEISHSKYQMISNETIRINGNLDFHEQAANNSWLGSGTASDPYIIEKYHFNASIKDLLWINSTDVHFKVRNNIFTGLNGTNFAIYLKNVSYCSIENNLIDRTGRGVYLEKSKYITIVNNSITNIGRNTTTFPEYPIIERSGIFLLSSRKIKISNNEIINPLFIGILLEDSSSNIIERNSITKAINGLILVNNRENMFQAVGYYPGSSKDNIIQNNEIYDNTDGGIYLLCWDKASVSNNTIIGNIVSNNEVAVGFGGENVTFSNNTLENNNLGLFLGLPTQHYYAKGWLITDNLIVNNNYVGIVIESSAENSIINNTIYKNGFGISIETVDTNKAEKNLIRSNDFIRNNVGSDQAADLGTDNVFERNYWDDWTSPDNNGDGIVDIPYTIGNDSIDLLPMVKPIHKRIHLYAPSFLYPNRSEVINGNVTVRWLPAIDIEDHSIEYSLYLSSDEGNSWSPLVLGTTNLGYDWDTTSVSDGEYSLKIVAICNDNEEASDIIEFTINNSVATPTTTTQKASMSGLLILMFSLTCVVRIRSMKRKKRKRDN